MEILRREVQVFLLLRGLVKQAHFLYQDACAYATGNIANVKGIKSQPSMF